MRKFNWLAIAAPVLLITAIAMLAVGWFLADGDPEAGRLVVQLIAAGEPAVMTVEAGEISTEPGVSDEACVTIEGDPASILRRLARDPDVLGDEGSVGVSGDESLLDRIRPKDDPAVLASLAARS